MSTMALSINLADKARLLRMLTMFPKETYKGLGRAGSTVRSKMRKVMRTGGGEGVPMFKPHSSITTALYGPHKIGGVLAEGSAIQMYKSGKDTITIGFISALEKWASLLQTEESHPFDQDEYRSLRRVGWKTLPLIYERPARPVVEPLGKHYEPQFIKWALRNTEKILAKAK